MSTGGALRGHLTRAHNLLVDAVQNDQTQYKSARRRFVDKFNKHQEHLISLNDTVKIMEYQAWYSQFLAEMDSQVDIQYLDVDHDDDYV